MTFLTDFVGMATTVLPAGFSSFSSSTNSNNNETHQTSEVSLQSLMDDRTRQSSRSGSNSPELNAGRPTSPYRPHTSSFEHLTPSERTDHLSYLHRKVQENNVRPELSLKMFELIDDIDRWLGDFRPSEKVFGPDPIFKKGLNKILLNISDLCNPNHQTCDRFVEEFIVRLDSVKEKLMNFWPKMLPFLRNHFPSDKKNADLVDWNLWRQMLLFLRNRYPSDKTIADLVEILNP